MAMRRPRPSSSGSSRPAATTSRAIDGLHLDIHVDVHLAVEAVQDVTHPLALRAQVALVVRVRDDLERKPLHDLEPEPFEAAVLRWVVRQHAHRRDAEVDEDLRADAVLAT